MAITDIRRPYRIRCIAVDKSTKLNKFTALQVILLLTLNTIL